ncbi:MAG: GNAT family N-acetyltransferase [Legionellaceae bacterium]|nr:GNAT family N-acetyltransferase [Legionellaceae bacterium]
MKNIYVIEHMKEAEVRLVMDWSRRAGWNPGLHDARCFYTADPQGFFVGKLDDKAIAVGSAVIYDDNFAFCGCYMVDPAYQGQGYGLTLTHKRLAHVKQRNAGLDGVLNMLKKYERLGYVTAHYNARYEIQPQLIIDAPLTSDIIPVKNLPFSTLAEYDRRHFPAPRDKFLRCWVAQPGARSLGFMKAGVLCGYGVIRPCHEGFKIGPLFANDRSIAHALFLNLIQHASGEVVYLDCPTNNPDAMALVKYYDLKQVFETARMYLRGEPDISVKHIYGMTSFELG